eukprot:Phypoly_transcript_06023.p1 GENE.Phypoly_transcript_06023~~Phypoly_transcript_06023.p1  ORF type:complete len:551 (+),score=62.68 Phypoly_transcript_06023:96-1748(+)
MVVSDLYSDVYNMIKTDALGNASSVLIFVSTDCDSLCACRILTSILESDCIKFTTYPVAGPDDLTNADANLIQDNDELRSIIMINCGGGVNLMDYFTLAENVVVYVIDSHRPYSAQNIVNDSSIVIIDDGVDKKIIDEIKPPIPEEEEEGLTDRQRSRKRKQAEDDLQRGYVGKTTYFGTSASSLLFTIAEKTHKDNLDDLLWYAIVGMSDQVVHERISPEQYMTEVARYQTLVKNMFLEDDEAAIQSHTSSDSITPVDDYRFMLYRHWNLYDSMYYSRYIATKLGIWKHTGKQMLDTLLAKMGLPLEECRQPYASMSVEFKKQLKTAIDTYSSKFGLDQIHFPSFQRQIGFKEQLSATDIVYAVTALLEADGPSQEAVPWEANFWNAYDALSSRNLHLLHKGLELAVEHHQAIVRQGVSMMERKAIIQAGPFRYSIVPETPDLHFFTHPLALSRLALFLVETRVLSENKPHKPIVLAALRSSTSTYITVGVSGSSFSGQEPNEFALNFKKAAQRTGARVTRNSFDGSVVEVLMNDLPGFIETVHQGLQN